MLQGTAVDSRSVIASLTLNGNEVPIGQDGWFEWRVPLAVGFIAGGGSLTVGSTVGMLDGVPFSMDAAPIIKNGRTLLPIRPLIERPGGQVRWDPRTRTATVTLGANSVVPAIDRNAVTVDGKSVQVDEGDGKVVPEVIGGRAYLPLRLVADNLGLDLTWDPVARVIAFTYWPE